MQGRPLESDWVERLGEHDARAILHRAETQCFAGDAKVANVELDQSRRSDGRNRRRDGRNRRRDERSRDCRDFRLTPDGPTARVASGRRRVLAVVAADSSVGTVTVLFTDLVGSTALRARMGEEAADALRITHDDLLFDAIVTWRGTVVKRTGDGVMATFSAAVDAVSAAVAIQQVVDQHNRRSAEERLEVRVGISVGDVSLAGDDCFGLPVIEAQRLESSARGGQILCADIVRHLARGRGGHEFASIGELELKGIPEPVPAAEVRWEPVVPGSLARDLPLPSALTGPRGFDLAGRTEELGVLVNAWKESSEGRRRVVFVSGEPGIGKTRLAVEAALVARDQGGLVIAGRCDEKLALPYQPFVEALRFQVERGDLPAAWLGPLAGELSRLVQSLPQREPGLASPVRADPETERARMFEAVTAWLRTTAASVPLLFVLDDLQWADEATLLLLHHVVRGTSRDSLCIVGTYRSTDLDRTHPLSALLFDSRRDASSIELALDGLSADGVAELLARAAGHDLDEAGVGLADALFTETVGNPFFVGEIVRHLVESGALVNRDGRWTSDLRLEHLGLPDSVRAVIDRRVARLDQDGQRLLSIAAVVGHEFALPLLVAVADADQDRTLDLLDAAVHAGLIDEAGPDRYRFAHALIRSALLDELTVTRRVHTHRKTAEAIEALNADQLAAFTTELAYHYGEAAVNCPEKAMAYATAAGDQAYGGAAAAEAARWFGFALEHADAAGADSAVRVDLLTRLGLAEWVSGASSARQHLLAAARLARDAELHVPMAEALVVRIRTAWNQGQESDPDKIELLEYVLDRLDDEPALHARAQCALAGELVFVGDKTRRGKLVDSASKLAELSGDALALADVATMSLLVRPPSTLRTGDLPAEVQLFRDALAAAEALNDVSLITTLLYPNAILACVTGDGEGLRSHVARLEDLVAANAGAVAPPEFLVLTQTLATIEGRLIEAEALANEQFELLRVINLQEAIAYRATAQLAVRREQGRLAEIIPAWRAFELAQPGMDVVDGTLAYTNAVAGDRHDAETRVDRAHSTRFATVADDNTWFFALAMWTEAAVAVEHRAAAKMLYDIQISRDGAISGTGGIICGPVARLLALVDDLHGQPDNADRHFAEAIEQSQALSPVWTARCQLDRAESRLQRGDHVAARELVDATDATIGALTLPHLQQRSAQLRTQLE